MLGKIGIRHENKDLTESRAALTPGHVKKLVEKYKVEVVVEPSNTRIFPDSEYHQAGAEISSDLSDCNLIFGVKEIPTGSLNPQQAYCFFSHTIKGQDYNMPLLKRMLDLKDTLLDYERVTDRQGRRLIFFGKFAGYAGMIDTVWTLGLRLQQEGIDNPFSEIGQALEYQSLDEARAAFRRVGHKISEKGLPDSLVPFICGFTGYGHVSRGAQEIYGLLPAEVISPADLVTFVKKGEYSAHKVYKVEFRESDMFRHRENLSRFDLNEYYKQPERYRSVFKNYIPFLTLLINGIYWELKYPRLVTRKYLKSLFQREPKPRLRVIGDITCDVNGSIECNVKATNSLNPVYTYNPITDQIQDGYESRGIVVLAVDKLPSELPREASFMFGNSLLPFVPTLARTDFNLPFGDLKLPVEFGQALIAHQGRLAPAYRYLRKFIKSDR